MKIISWSGQAGLLLTVFSTVGYCVELLHFRLALLLLAAALVKNAQIIAEHRRAS
jgi:hypothetical protein